MELAEFLQQSVAVLGAAVAVVFVSAKLRVPSVVGLILTGLLIGPSGLALVHDPEQVEMFAEIGVVLLLFTIGLELSIGELKGLGRAFFLGGGLQVGLTLLAALGLSLLWVEGWPPAIFVAMVVALSSTAVVLKLYDQRRETHTPQGRIVLGVLLLQDFLIVPMIVVTPMLGGTMAGSAVDVLRQIGVAVAAVVAVVFLARYVMPRLLDQIVRTGVRELSVLGALVVVLALSWFTWSLGFSLALGAFVAGILVSETEYSHQVVADIIPFRDVFASLFFVSIGMLVDLRYALEHLPMLLGLAAGLVALKGLLASLAIAGVGYPVRIAVISGLGLAQIGEFSFVLMEVGRQAGLLDADGFQTLLVAAVMTLLATPLLIRYAPGLGERLQDLFSAAQEAAAEDPTAELSSHVIIVGYGVNGSLLARVLGQTHIRFVVVEFNANTVREARRQDVPILYGDASRREILERAGIERAQVVVFAISDAPVVLRSVQMARRLNPAVEIVVRTRMVREIEALRGAGANDVVAEEFEAAIEIFTLVLERFHVPRNVIRAQTRVLRGEGYRMLRSASLGRGVSDAVLEALEAGTTDIYRVGEESRAAGATLRDLDLRRRTGASVIAVVRGETSHPNPSPEVELEPGDSLVLVGSHQEIDEAFVFLDRKEQAPRPIGSA